MCIVSPSTWSQFQNTELSPRRGASVRAYSRILDPVTCRLHGNTAYCARFQHPSPEEAYSHILSTMCVLKKRDPLVGANKCLFAHLSVKETTILRSHIVSGCCTNLLYQRQLVPGSGPTCRTGRTYWHLHSLVLQLLGINVAQTHRAGRTY